MYRLMQKFRILSRHKDLKKNGFATNLKKKVKKNETVNTNLSMKLRIICFQTTCFSSGATSYFHLVSITE